ncbi:MAG: porin [Opitutaceae bacterium]|nr:porin [Opitutaceae bacterium]
MPSKRTFAVVASIAAFLGTTPLPADEASLQSEVDELKKVVAELKQELRAVSNLSAIQGSKIVEQETKLAETQAQQAIQVRDTFKTAGNEPVTASDLESVREQQNDQLDRRLRVRNGVGVVLTGSSIVRYTDSATGSRGFTIPSATFGFTGALRSDPAEEGDVRYGLSLNYAGATNTTRLQDAFVNVGVKSLQKKELEPAYTLGFQLGQQAVFFGNDNVGGEELRPTITGAAYLSAFNTRDIGLVASGGINWKYDSAATSDQSFVPTIAYTFAAFNGNGVGATNVQDDNDGKAYLGKLVYTPFNKYNSFFQGLKVGASRLQWTSGTGAAAIDRELNGVQFEWLKLPLLITAEYVWGKDDPVGTGATVDKDEFLATVFWRPGKLPDFEPLVRFERFNTNKNLAENGRRDITTVGFNYYFWQKDPIVRRTYDTVKTERVIKVQANYRFIEDETLAATAPNPNQLVTQVVLAF